MICGIILVAEQGIGRISRTILESPLLCLTFHLYVHLKLEDDSLKPHSFIKLEDCWTWFQSVPLLMLN